MAHSVCFQASLYLFKLDIVCNKGGPLSKLFANILLIVLMNLSFSFGSVIFRAIGISIHSRDFHTPI